MFSSIISAFIDSMTGNVKTIGYVVIGTFLGLFAVWSFYNYNAKKRLERENNILVHTKKVQENIIDIEDKKTQKGTELKFEIKKKEEDIKSTESKDLPDFIKKSDCVFKNFGKKDYECN